MSSITAKKFLFSESYLFVMAKSPTALTCWDEHPSKVSVASLKAATASLTSLSLKVNSSAH